jgi:hypothetical protein
MKVAFNSTNQNGSSVMRAIFPSSLFMYSSPLIKVCQIVRTTEGKLDKPATSYDEVFDAFRMSLSYWR